MIKKKKEIKFNKNRNAFLYDQLYVIINFYYYIQLIII